MPTITTTAVQAFLGGHRIAVVGASDTKGSFGRTICQALADHGYEPVPVHPRLTALDGRQVFPHLTDIPGTVDGVVVMVNGADAPAVIDDAAAAGITQVWLFRGIGGKSAVSPASLAACDRHGIDPIAGACPLMFLEPASAVHRIHRSVRRLRGDLEKAR